jgi:hypothetical protein
LKIKEERAAVGWGELCNEMAELLLSEVWLDAEINRDDGRDAATAVCSTDAGSIGAREIMPLKFTLPAWASIVISGVNSDVLVKISWTDSAELVT